MKKSTRKGSRGVRAGRARNRAPKRAARRVRITPEIRAYVRKIDAYRGGRAPLPLMRVGPAKIARAIQGLRSAQLKKRPAPGKWSIAEILGHLVDTEVVYGYRYRLALSQPGVPIPGYDQATWTVALKHRNRNPARLMAQIATLRKINLDLIESMPRRTWERYGMHSERGKETVRRTAELIAGHDLNHLDQIQTIKKKYGW
ncbi:MAG TPA: DinB family protein [Candidatus Eisenbacteria bacterium]|nr:DinB family protein [Candidatus Eisenbacteria bacterium]